MNPLRQQIQSALHVEPTDTGFRATLHIDPSLLILPAHFPDHPILPGICMIQAVLLAAAQIQSQPNLHLRKLQKAKWLLPVRPNDHLTIEAEIKPAAENQFAIKAKLSLHQKRCAEFSLLAFPTIEGVNP